MRVIMSVMAVAVACCSGAIESVSAQEYAVVQESKAKGGRPESQTGRKEIDVLSVVVSVDLVNVPMRIALDEVTKKSGVPLFFSPALVPMDRRVTVKGKKLPLRDALRQMLRGTDVEVRVGEEGGVVLVAKDATRSKGQVTQGTIVGKVLHAKTKQPIAGATVSVGDAREAVVSGQDGTFRISVGVGERMVSIRAVGFVRQTKKVQSVEGQTVNLEVLLEPSASVLDEVVVTGTVIETERRAIATPITVITAEDIERRGITRIDEFFRGEVPGVVALDMGTSTFSSEQLGAMQSSNVYSRGSSSLNGSPNPLKTFIDGIEMADSRYLGTIDPKSIERIEIISGPQAATIYGSGAIGGVMQIFTKRGMATPRPDITVNLKYGTLQNSITTTLAPQHDDAVRIAGGTGTEFSYSGTFSHRYTGQWQSGMYSRTYAVSAGVVHRNGPLTLDGSYMESRGANGSKKVYNTGLGASASWVGDLGESPLIQEWYTSGFFRPGTFPGDRQVKSSSLSQQIGFNVDWKASSFWQHHLTIGKHANEFSREPEAPTYTAVWDTLFRADASHSQRISLSYNTSMILHTGPLSHTGTLGWTRSSATGQSTSGCKLSPASADPFIGCFASTVPSIIDRAPDRSWGGFASVRTGIFDNVFVNVSLRGERNAQYGNDLGIDWTPNYGITTTFDVGQVTLKLLTSYGAATRQPPAGSREARTSRITGYEPAEYLGQITNPLLGPEFSRGGQVGAEIYVGNVVSLTVNRYVQTVKDLIVSQRVDSVLLQRVSDSYETWASVVQRINGAVMKQQGWSTTGNLRISAFSLSGSYSWDDSRTDYHPSPTYPIQQSLRMVPTHSGSITGVYASGGTSVSMTANYVGSVLQYQYVSNVDAALNSMRSYIRVPTYDLTWYGFATLVPQISAPGNTRVNLSASHRLTPSATLTMNVVNLANRVGSEVGVLYPSLGRQVLAGLSLRFQ